MYKNGGRHLLRAVSETAMRNKNLKYLAAASLFAALTFITSMLHLPLFSSQGYIHLGDSVIYLAASFLPFPYAAAAAAAGGVLGDMLSGYFIWIPFTAVIKILNVMPFAFIKKYNKKSKKRINFFNISACVISGIITCVMYFFSSRILYGSFAAAIADLPGNVVQSAASAVIYLLISSVPALRHALKNLIEKDDKNG